ncbi:unnamed protein product [Camellia sinensis]
MIIPEWCLFPNPSMGIILGFINGTVTIPSKETKLGDYASWRRCNDMILPWILNSLTMDLTDSVIYSNTAQEVWEDLRDRFSRSNVPRIFQIERDIACLTQGQLTVAAYYIKLKGLWDELGSYQAAVCTCGADHQRCKLMQLLMGLNESYSAIRRLIILMNPLPDVTKIPKTAAMIAHRNEPTMLAVRQSSTFRSNNRKPLHCSYCNQDHHVRDTCWKLHGYPLGHPKHHSTKSVQGRNRPKQFNGNQSPANNVTDGLTMQEMQLVIHGLSDSQFQQILSVMNGKETTSSAPPHAYTVGVPSANHLLNPYLCSDCHSCDLCSVLFSTVVMDLTTRMIIETPP